MTDLNPVEIMDNPAVGESETERLRRWRMILGQDKDNQPGETLSARDLAIDRALGALYDSDRSGGLSGSNPAVARWLGDIRTYFPASTVQMMQQDALDRLGLRQMLFQPELMEAVEPDVNLAATILTLKGAIPVKTRETARTVVRRVTDQVMKRLQAPLRQAIAGSLNRSVRNSRPRLKEIDWNRTIRANLKNYQPELNTVIAERPVGYGRKGSSLKDVILVVDQSGSMAGSVVYAGIIACVMASIPALKTSLVVFDTSVVDLTEKLTDPVEVLFGTQLGGGTDINKALCYAHSLVRRPADTVMILISDLYEGGPKDNLYSTVAAILGSGVNLITLLALDDRGAPGSDPAVASAFAELGSVAFGCTPDLFPEMIAAAILKRDMAQWAANAGVATARKLE